MRNRVSGLGNGNANGRRLGLAFEDQPEDRDQMKRYRKIAQGSSRRGRGWEAVDKQPVKMGWGGEAEDSFRCFGRLGQMDQMTRGGSDRVHSGQRDAEYPGELGGVRKGLG